VRCVGGGALAGRWGLRHGLRCESAENQSENGGVSHCRESSMALGDPQRLR